MITKKCIVETLQLCFCRIVGPCYMFGICCGIRYQLYLCVVEIKFKFCLKPHSVPLGVCCTPNVFTVKFGYPTNTIYICPSQCPWTPTSCLSTMVKTCVWTIYRSVFEIVFEFLLFLQMTVFLFIKKKRDCLDTVNMNTRNTQKNDTQL